MKLQIKLKRYTTTFYLLFLMKKEIVLKTVSQKSYQQVIEMVINSINVFYVFDKNRYTKE